MKRYVGHACPAPGLSTSMSPSMRTYVIRRLLLFIPTLFILSMLVFLASIRQNMCASSPGDIVDVLMTDHQVGATEDDKERTSKLY